MSHRIDILHPRELDEADARAWSDLQGAHGVFSSPLLSPQFASALGEVREDARIAIAREGGKASGFLAFHHRPGAFGRPIGAPFSDLHGLVGRPDMDLRGGVLLQAAGLRVLSVNGLVDPFGLMADGPQSPGVSHRIVLNRDTGGYLGQTRAQSRNGAKNLKRYSWRLGQDVGALSLRAPDRTAGSLERLLAWKSAQLRASGMHDVLAADWVKALMRRLFETRHDGFEGLMMGLYAADRLVAGQFGVRLVGHFHPWIAAMDPELRAYSPGMIFQWQAIEAMPGLALDTYELGPGEAHWKQMFALDALPVRMGVVVAAGAAGRASARTARLYDWPSRRVETIGRLRRRLDHIAATELTLSGRARGVFSALANYERRNAARRAAGAGGSA